MEGEGEPWDGTAGSSTGAWLQGSIVAEVREDSYRLDLHPLNRTTQYEDELSNSIFSLWLLKASASISALC